MNTQRIIGIVLLVVGVILFIVGLNASDSFADQLSRTFTGKWTDNTAWYIYGGLGLGVLGLLAATLGRGGKTA
jgi:multisubunit Na+/H+ antiporter MnhB subunit